MGIILLMHHIIELIGRAFFSFAKSNSLNRNEVGHCIRASTARNAPFEPACNTLPPAGSNFQKGKWMLSLFLREIVVHCRALRFKVLAYDG